ncbi:acyltransferase, partial [Francisella tularensis subsp. holarctica]|nr:acyltransferase [Francisella tularensis subsp. holarctica]
VGDYFNDDKDKHNFQLWMNKLWQNNDQYISEQSKIVN